jgi:hypothetical protein
MKKIEQVAGLLLKLKVSFNYSPTFLEVKNNEKIPPFTATYHAGNGKLILMDGNYHECTLEGLFAQYLEKSVQTA